MKHQFVVSAMAVALSLSAAGSLQAAPLLATPHAVNDKQPSAKLVSFQMRNDSANAFTIKAGEQPEMTLQPGKSVALKVAEGVQVVAVNGTSNLAAGSVVTMVTKQLQGNTLAVR